MAHRESPEERELAKKQEELHRLEETLAQHELDLLTLQNQLRVFEAKYLTTVGILYAELDDLEAQLVEAKAETQPRDQTLADQARAARRRAAHSSEAVHALQGNERSRFDATDSLKNLYREVARQIHPDLAPDDATRIRRNRLMAEANEAYARGDEAKLAAILDDWHSSPEAVEGVGVAAELVRTIRSIHRVEQRLEEIAAQLSVLTASSMYQLMDKVAKAETTDRDLLTEMAGELKRRIDDARRRLRRQASSSEVI